MLERRARDRAIGVDAYLEPYPDPVAPASLEPPACVESDEAVGLAFIAAMQLLPPKQRVVLVLRDVLDWSAREVAELLDDSDAAVNSALQRARARIATAQREGSLARAHRPASADVEALVMQRFQDAWKAVDIDGILALLTADALLTMPPEGMRFEGAGAIAEFFATVPLGGRLDRIRLVPRRANGQPALAAYAESPEAGAYEAYGVMVFAIDGEQIAGITGFPRRPELFGRLGLPAEITQ
jgi:RNA polymerase sigma-70 factor (ECF subfamily)